MDGIHNFSDQLAMVAIWLAFLVSRGPGIRDHLLFLMMYRHGLRCSEAIDLRMKDISFR
jgi:site-specific recombinase XerD